MAIITSGKKRPARGTTTQINALTDPPAAQVGSWLYDSTIDKFRYFDGADWIAFPVGPAPGYGQQELASDVALTTSTDPIDTFEIEETGTWLVSAVMFVEFPNTVLSAAQTTEVELRRDGGSVAKHFLSMKRSGYIVCASIKAFVLGPCTIDLVVSSLESTEIILKSYANAGSIMHWLRVV
jgi:hypothetical protein